MRRRAQAPLTEQYPIPEKAKAFFSAEEWADWRYGSWDEGMVGQAIMRRVATPEERSAMASNALDYAQMVNGRVEGDTPAYALMVSLFKAWNDRLGYEVFGGFF